MAKRITVEFDVMAWLGGTSGMPAEMKGIYITLLMRQRLDGDLPRQVWDLARKAGVDTETMRRNWVMLQSKFVDDGNGRIYNKRMRREMEKGCGEQSVLFSEPAGEVAEVDDWEFAGVSDAADGKNEFVLRQALDEYANYRASRKPPKPIASKRRFSRQFKNFDGTEHLLYAIDLAISNNWIGIKPEYRQPDYRSQSKPKKSKGEQSFDQGAI